RRQVALDRPPGLLQMAVAGQPQADRADQEQPQEAQLRSAAQQQEAVGAEPALGFPGGGGRVAPGHALACGPAHGVSSSPRTGNWIWSPISEPPAASFSSQPLR